MSWQEAETQLMLPQVQRGVDYGALRPVLLQRGNRCLAVEPSHTFTVALGTRTTSPMRLVLADMGGSAWGGGPATDLFAGRLSRAKLAAAAPRIAAWLGCTVEGLPPIHRRKTFVWLDEPETEET
jgi:hypothetical protein